MFTIEIKNEVGLQVCNQTGEFSETGSRCRSAWNVDRRVCKWVSI